MALFVSILNSVSIPCGEIFVGFWDKFSAALGTILSIKVSSVFWLALCCFLSMPVKKISTFANFWVDWLFRAPIFVLDLALDWSVF